MRLPVSLLVLASLVALPATVLAQRPPPPRPGTGAPPPAPPRPVVRPTDVHREPGPNPTPVPVRPYTGPYHVPPPPPQHWWALGWGWGWYPLYVYGPPAPPPPPPEEGYAPPPPQPPPERDRIVTGLSIYGAARDDGYMGGLTFSVEGRHMGFDLDLSALAREQVTGPLHAEQSDPINWTTTHVTWAIVGQRSLRLRLETGASVLALPDSPATAGREWRGKTLIGPDVGLSGQLGLLPHVAVEGYARYTPLPTRVADTFVGLTVHGGPLGLSAGWRWVDIAGDEHDAPKLMFRGPQAGLVVRF